MIVLKDNSPVPKEHSDLCREIQKQIDRSGCVLVDLLSNDGPVTRRPQIFSYREDGTFTTGNFVGQFEVHTDDGTQRVVIGARGPGFREDPSRRDMQGKFLLRAMLEACWSVPLAFVEEKDETSPAADYDELLAARLAAQLDRAWRKGPLRVYRTFQRRDSRVKGRLDIPREIRQGMGQPDGCMAYEVREYTGDNDYNRLFFLACREAEKQHPALLLHLRKLLPGYNLAYRSLQSACQSRLDASALLSRTQKKITNPIYRDYETLRGISHAFLRRQGNYSRVNHKSSAPFVTGIFLDISLLWERYLLAKVLPDDAVQHYQQEKYILDENMLVIPDFLWQEAHVVLDAKYRFGWGATLEQKKWRGSLHDDVYQVLTYMLALGCEKGGVIFPVDQRRKGDSQHALNIPVKKIDGGFWRFPFGVPDETTDYSVFRQAMEQESQELSRQIAQLFVADAPEIPKAVSNSL